ncbi:MAG: hypothetical protein ABW080_04720 [Candidatus Thiodiazotropha sp.]
MAGLIMSSLPILPLIVSEALYASFQGMRSLSVLLNSMPNYLGNMGGVLSGVRAP